MGQSIWTRFAHKSVLDRAHVRPGEVFTVLTDDRMNPAIAEACFNVGLTQTLDTQLVVIRSYHHSEEPVHLNKAELYLELGDVEMSAVSCGRALTIFKAAKNVLAEAETYRMLGRIFARRGDQITAMGLFDHSLEMAKAADAPLEIAETYRAMGLAHERLGHADRAVEALEQALTYFQRVQARGDMQATEEDLARLR